MISLIFLFHEMSTSFGFVLGVIAAVFGLVFMKQKKDDKKKSANDGFKGISVFINFCIIDKEEAIQNGVEGDTLFPLDTLTHWLTLH